MEKTVAMPTTVDITVTINQHWKHETVKHPIYGDEKDANKRKCTLHLTDIEQNHYAVAMKKIAIQELGLTRDGSDHHASTLTAGDVIELTGADLFAKAVRETRTAKLSQIKADFVAKKITEKEALALYMNVT